jgi:hypothetical protein
MYAALAEYLRDVKHLDAVEVTDFEDVQKSDGYCETCYYEYMACDITYKNSAGKTQVYEYYGTVAELVRNLT